MFITSSTRIADATGNGWRFRWNHQRRCLEMHHKTLIPLWYSLKDLMTNKPLLKTD